MNKSKAFSFLFIFSYNIQELFFIATHLVQVISFLCRYQKRVSNIIDDVLEWNPRLALSGMMDKQPVVNSTEANDNFTNESKTNSQEAAAHDEVDGETISLQHEDEEVTEDIEDKHDDM